jgi:hypothetical protein
MNLSGFTPALSKSLGRYGQATGLARFQGLGGVQAQPTQANNATLGFNAPSSSTSSSSTQVPDARFLFRYNGQNVMSAGKLNVVG